MYKVVVSKSNLQFAASHFITYGGKCELLHGHNYEISVQLEGKLSDDGYLFDFVVLKQITRLIIAELDHHFLLALNNPNLSIHRDETSWEILYQEARYVFPIRDVKPLPVDNITAERLAEYIWNQVSDEIKAQDAVQVVAITIGVEESSGQTAYYRSPVLWSHNGPSNR